MHNLRSLWFAFLAASLWGCTEWHAPLSEQEIEATFGSSANELKFSPGLRTWPKVGDVYPIQVCFGSPGWVEWDSSVKAVLRDAIERTWEVHTLLDFQGFGQCPADLSNKIVVQQMFEGGGMVSMGNDDQCPTCASNTVKARFNIPSATVYTPVGCLGGVGAACHNDWNTFVHEFGHAVGFGHEQESTFNFDSSGNPIFCDQTGPSLSGANLTTSFDPASMMNYCNFDVQDWEGKIIGKTNSNGMSWQDAQGAQSIYESAASGTWTALRTSALGTLL